MQSICAQSGRAKRRPPRRRRGGTWGIGKRMRSPMLALMAALARGASACDSSYLFPNVTESGEPS